MSALGQKQTCAVHQPMSALPLIATAKADIQVWQWRRQPPPALMPNSNDEAGISNSGFDPPPNLPTAIASDTPSSRERGRWVPASRPSVVCEPVHIPGQLSGVRGVRRECASAREAI